MKSAILFVLGAMFVGVVNAADIPDPGPEFKNPRVAQTEGKVLDATCNCEVPGRGKNPALDENLVQKIREQAGNPKDEAKKLMAKVKSYKCPRIKKPKGRDEDFEMDEMEELDSSEILDMLIAKANVNVDVLDYEDKDRAEEMLEKKVDKCNQKIAAQMMKSGPNSGLDSSSSSGSNNNSSMMMMRLAQMMMAMNSQYSQSSFNGLYGYNPYMNRMNTMGTNTTGILGYSPVNQTIAANSDVTNYGLTNYGYNNTGYLNNYLWNYGR